MTSIKNNKTLAEKIDYFFNKMLPKKFLVILTASIFVAYNKLSGDIWAYLAMIYIGTNGLQHIGFNISDAVKNPANVDKM